MRVSLVTFDHGESVVPLASALARNAAVQLIVPERELEPFRDELDDAVRVTAFHKPRLRQPARQLGTVRRILREIQRFDPQVVHLQQGHLWFNPALRALGSRPLVLTVHDPRPHPGDRGGRKTPRFVSDLAFRRADHMIVHAEDVRRTLVAGWHVPAERIDVIPLAFGSRPLTPRDREFSAPRFLFFGRIWPYKGLEYLIRAEPSVSEHVPGAEIVIAGGGEDFDRYRRSMVHPERFRVEYGHISVERREELFGEAYAVVLPYVEATQTGVVPLAYRHGKPVIATAVGGLPEVVTHAATGYVVPPRDSEALAAAMVRAYGDRTAWVAMGAQARHAFESTHTPDMAAAPTLRAYERVLSSRARGPHTEPSRHP